jgi:hypothetical protein
LLNVCIYFILFISNKHHPTWWILGMSIPNLLRLADGDFRTTTWGLRKLTCEWRIGDDSYGRGQGWCNVFCWVPTADAWCDR